MNIADLWWYHWISWPSTWSFSCQNQISRLLGSWDIDETFLRQPFCKIQDGGHI